MEQVLPALENIIDPIWAAIHCNRHGDRRAAIVLLQDVLGKDLRCLDAHAHLGNLVFPTFPAHALLHYEIGIAIGDYALGAGFTGALPWSYLDNRPFLRCLHSQALALWRLNRTEEAAHVFERLLRLNPADGQGAKQNLADLQAGCDWEDNV